jgi:hypothetical protein
LPVAKVPWRADGRTNAHKCNIRHSLLSCDENSRFFNLQLRDRTFNGKLPDVPACREFTEVQKDLDDIVDKIKATGDPEIRHTLLKQMMVLVREALGEVEAAAAVSRPDPRPQGSSPTPAAPIT